MGQEQSHKVPQRVQPRGPEARRSKQTSAHAGLLKPARILASPDVEAILASVSGRRLDTQEQQVGRAWDGKAWGDKAEKRFTGFPQKDFYTKEPKLYQKAGGNSRRCFSGVREAM